jgi:hypothetical protein
MLSSSQTSMDPRRLRFGRWRFAAFALLLLCIAVTRGRAIAGRLPYGQHVDEIHLTSHAHEMLVRRDLNPRFFRYPSLPIYLTLGSMRLGAAFGPDVPPSRWKLSHKGDPFSPGSVLAVTRYVFSALSILTLALVGWMARRLTGSALMLLVAPVLLATSRTFQTSAAVYLNVDVVATFFVVAALAVLPSSRLNAGRGLLAVVPGVLTGMAVASKYSVVLVAVPCLLTIVLSRTERKAEKALIYVAVTVLVFVLCVPYSLLTPKAFLTDVLFEVRHYRTGHTQFEGPPGLPQIVYYTTELWKDYGPLTCIFAGIGAAWGVSQKSQPALTLLSLPVLMLLHMATNRVHFLRTVLPIFALVPVFAAAGLYALSSFVRDRACAFTGRPWSSGWFRSVLGFFVTVGCGVAVALGNFDIVFDRNLEADSRNRATDWLASHAADGSVFVAPDLRFSVESLRLVGGREVTPTIANLGKLASRPAYVVVPAYPGPKHDHVALPTATLEALRSIKGAKVYEADGLDTRWQFRGLASGAVLNPALAIFRVP